MLALLFSSRSKRVYSGIFGCAYYDPQKCTIYAVEDMQENAKYDAIKMR